MTYGIDQLTFNDALLGIWSAPSADSLGCFPLRRPLAEGREKGTTLACLWKLFVRGFFEGPNWLDILAGVFGSCSIPLQFIMLSKALLSALKSTVKPENRKKTSTFLQ